MKMEGLKLKNKNQGTVELDYVYHIKGQRSQGFYHFQKKKMADLEAALKEQKIEFTIERRRL